MAPQEINVEQLCEQIKKDWPQELRDETWYLAMVRTFVSNNQSFLLSIFHGFNIGDPNSKHCSYVVTLELLEDVKANPRRVNQGYHRLSMLPTAIG